MCLIGSSVSVATCMTIGVYGNPQFSIWSWAVNYGFAYNLPTNASYVLHPPEDVATYPFYDPEEKKDAVASTAAPEPTTMPSSSEIMDSTNSTRRNFYVYQRPQKFETQPMIHRRFRRDIYRNIEAVIDKYVLLCHALKVSKNNFSSSSPSAFHQLLFFIPLTSSNI